VTVEEISMHSVDGLRLGRVPSVEQDIDTGSNSLRVELGAHEVCARVENS
jgi:hypothetical protein